MFRPDPGPCPICDALHCGCTLAGRRGDTIVILSQRDAMQAEAVSVEPPAELVPPVVEAEPAPFTTSSYDRKKHGLKRPRR